MSIYLQEVLYMNIHIFKLWRNRKKIEIMLSKEIERVQELIKKYEPSTMFQFIIYIMKKDIKWARKAKSNGNFKDMRDACKELMIWK